MAMIENLVNSTLVLATMLFYFLLFYLIPIHLIYMYMIMVGFSVLISPFFIPIILVALPIGYELVLVIFNINVSAETTPPGEWSIVTLKDPPSEESLTLQHSVSYEGNDAIETITKRIKIKTKNL